MDIQSAALVSSAPTARAQLLGARQVGGLLGVWICLYPFADLAFRPKVGTLSSATDPSGQPSPLLAVAYAGIVVLGIIPAGLGALSFGLDFRRAALFCASVVVICLSIPLSLLGLTDISTAYYVFLVYYVFLCAVLVISTNVRADRLLRPFLTATAVTLGVAMTAALIDHDYSWGRLIGRTAPDTWGGLALSTIIAVIAMRGWILKTILIGLSLFVIYAAQARADMMSLVAAFSVMAILFTRHPRARRWGWIWFFVALGVVAAIGLSSDYIFNGLLKMSDPARGWGSGLTGRTSTWREAWDIFASHPWFGVRYQQHQQYMTSQLAIHSVYLSTLADLGVVGLFGYLVFFFGALCRSLARAWRDPTGLNLTIAGFLSAFAVLSIVEPTGLHTGNTLSMLMIFVAAWAWRTSVPPTARNAGSYP